MNEPTMSLRMEVGGFTSTTPAENRNPSAYIAPTTEQKGSIQTYSSYFHAANRPQHSSHLSQTLALSSKHTISSEPSSMHKTKCRAVKSGQLKPPAF